MEQELTTGDEKVPGATFLSGEANVTEEVTTPIVGDRSLEATGAFEMEFPCPQATVSRAEFMTILLRRRGTFTGNFSLIFRSDVSGTPTDHFTQTVAIGTLTADVVSRLSKTFVVPTNLGSDPRIVVKLASTGGTGSVEFDELVGGVMSLFDGNRAVAIVDGTIKFRKGDFFAGNNAITYAADQEIQRCIVECFGRSVKHSATPTYWTTT